MLDRAREIVREVQETRNCVWDAYDQGRWAHAIGWTRIDNPHLRGHVNHCDWQRGWNAEQSKR